MSESRRYPFQKYREMLGLHLPKLPKPCRAVSEIIKGNKIYCGKVAPYTVKALDTGDPLPLCDEHYEDYQRLERERNQKG